MKRVIALLGAAFLAGILGVFQGCFAAPRVAASGTVAGYPLSGPVDSRVARDYLEGRPLPRGLAELRRTHLEAGVAPSREELALVAQRYSTDAATLLFIEAVSVAPAARRLRQRYERELSHVRQVGVHEARPEVPDDMLILLVPGWFYRSHGAETNADYRIQRALYERWGIRHELVPIDENGTVENNAVIVAKAIREASREHQIFLVSASKSGAEVALALGRELAYDETHAILGWLSIGGVVRGSPLADRILEPDICWFVELKLRLEGFDLEGAKSMQTSRVRPAFEALRFPTHVRIHTYVPVPLSGHVTERGSFGYGRMRALGPNDGLTLLSDELIPGATPILAPGVDHFLGLDDQRIWSTAIFRVIMMELAHRER